MSQFVGTDASKLITLAAKKAQLLGVGQSLSGEDLQDIFDILNMMLGEWSEQRLSVYHLVDAKINCNGSQFYTVGVGGTVNTASYPVRIESAYFTQNGVNYPFRVIHAKEDWIRISLPNLASFPEYIFMDSDYPLAKVYLWPVPNNTFSVTMQFMGALTQFQYLTDSVNLRPSYQAAIVNNLAVEICILFSLPIPPEVKIKATTTKRSMQKANTQIPLLQIPNELTRRGHYNILSDRNT